MPEKNEVVKMNTAVSQWANSLTELISRDFEICGVSFDEYSKKCAMACMMSIYQMIKDSDKVQDLNGIDTSNLRKIVGEVASLKLNANAIPRECYFQLRCKKVGNNYFNVVEMGIEGDGNDAILRNFGVGVKTVHPVWKVKEGDEFVYPKRKGIRMTEPEWEEKGISQKVIRIVYPIEMMDGHIEYVISERESVKSNLFAHVRNNLLNETFGLLKGTNSKGKPKTRYDATIEEKKAIDVKKNEIFDALIKCQTVDDMLSCEIARPYISAAWLDTPEAMIVRKMRNNAVKPFPKDFNSMAKQSFLEVDETYRVVQAEIEEKANSEEFQVIETEKELPFPEE